MVVEVDEEPLPAGWEVAMSRSKNMPYYYNARSKKVYWVDDALPRGWSHQFDQKGDVYYFHIRDKTATLTYDKPVLRRPSDAGDNLPVSPDPLPVPAPSYSDEPRIQRQQSNDSMDGSPRSRSGSTSSTSWRPPHDASPPPPIDPVPPRTMERKKSNSLMDLLSPGPPALAVAEQEDQRVTSTARSMDISNLVTPTVSGSKRTFEEMTKDEDPDAAAQFYNQLQRNATSDRADSLLFHMRAMNNWVKSILINEFAKRDDRVLDLACGKGGDLMKWAKRSISKYVGVDIAQKSLEDAVERFSGNAQHRDLDVAFVQGDLGRVSLTEDVLHCWSRDAGWHDAVPLQERGFFNVVSIQFSFHYMFGEEQRANRFFRTVHELLVDGGVFIATTVDPNKVLMKYFQGLNSPSDDDADQQRADIRVLDNKQREMCAIRFDDATRDQLSGYSAGREGSFGLRYNFTLRDTTDDRLSGGGEAVDLPEYLVPDDLLKRLLKEHGFELLLKQNFHHFISKNKDKRENRTLLEKMHVMNVDGSISDAEWEISGLYQVIAFKKAY